MKTSPIRLSLCQIMTYTLNAPRFRAPLWVDQRARKSHFSTQKSHFGHPRSQITVYHPRFIIIVWRGAGGLLRGFDAPEEGRSL